MRITEHHLERAKTVNGGYTRDQLSLLSVDWPLQKGWKSVLLQREYDPAVVTQFVEYHGPGTKTSVELPLDRFFTKTVTAFAHTPVQVAAMSLEDAAGDVRQKEGVGRSSAAPSLSSLLCDTDTDPAFEYNVYTDGACIHNGKPHAKAGIGVYFSPRDPRNTSESVRGHSTNNVAELAAVLKAHALVKDDLRAGKRVTIVSDSTYAIGCATHYGAACAKSQWGKDIPNKALVQQAYHTFRDEPNVRFLHVKAHTNGTDAHSVGNAHADRLASEAIGVVECPYQSHKGPRVYLSVPFCKKDAAKTLGAQWDSKRKSWYITTSHANKGAAVEQFGGIKKGLMPF